MIIQLIKQLFCKHEYLFVRNIHGDEINWCNGDRSWWICRKCGKRKSRAILIHTMDDIKKYNNNMKEYKSSQEMLEDFDFVRNNQYDE